MMSKKFRAAAAMLALVAGLTVSITGCNNQTSPGGYTSEDPNPEMNPSANYGDDGSDGAGGMGMTYTGKMGYNMGGGMVMPLNGGMPQMGTGF